MSFQKNALGACVGFWSLFWGMTGLSLAISPQAPGPLAFLTGLNREAIARFLGQNGFGSVDGSTAAEVLGVLLLAAGMSFASALYLAEPQDTRAMTLRSCAFAAFLVLLVGTIGVPGNGWTLVTDVLLLASLAATATVAAMDKHQEMPMMPVEPDRFREALLQRMAQDEALERYLDACRTSSQTSRVFASARPTRNPMPQA
jgi:hypothetical protein